MPPDYRHGGIKSSSAHSILNQYKEFGTDLSLDKRKKLLDFSDIDLIFKVTPAL